MNVKDKCWKVGCELKAVATARIVVRTSLENTLDLEIKACKEHFQVAWNDDFKPLVDRFLGPKEEGPKSITNSAHLDWRDSLG